MHRSIALGVIVLLAGCATAPTTITPVKPMFGEHGFDMSGLDRTVNACDNFYQFAVGNWRAQNPLPAAYSRFGRFEQVAERNRETLHAILEEASKKTNPPGSSAQKIGDFYAACMNEPAIEAAGFTPVADELVRIEAINDRTALQNEIFSLQTTGISPIFRLSGQNDQKNSRMIIAVVGQAGLSLPDRDYYLRDDQKFKTTRGQYVEHVSKMLQMVGEDRARAESDGDRILSFETDLARAQAAVYGAHAEVDYQRRYPVLVNDAQMTAFAKQVALDWVGADNLLPDMQPLTGSEDFAFLLERCAGSYLIIGNGDGEGGCMVHNPGYDFNDACLPTGASYWVQLAHAFLA